MTNKDEKFMLRDDRGMPMQTNVTQRPPVAPLGEEDAVSLLLNGYNEGKAHAVAFKHPQAALRHYLKYAYRALLSHLTSLPPEDEVK